MNGLLCPVRLSQCRSCIFLSALSTFSCLKLRTSIYFRFEIWENFRKAKSKSCENIYKEMFENLIKNISKSVVFSNLGTPLTMGLG
ncbi:unnamed protein product [Moneuplotes crassus]|uniref:Uncharacterized protein n=1 Tax=Euplotes crassus TaxID=5936 RepID=A0AAD1Y5J5_EUPCR|nr:unnamed protein product [Moneuplotes crassus]